jgi:hypothetical protein
MVPVRTGRGPERAEDWDVAEVWEAAEVGTDPGLVPADGVSVPAVGQVYPTRQALPATI